MTGETPYISEYLYFVWYGRAWFKKDDGLRDIQIGRFLGPPHKVGSLMSYWILLKSGIIFSRTTVQCVTYLDICTDANKQLFEVYNKDIKERFPKKYTEEALAGPNSTKPNMERWAKMSEYGEDFQY